MYFKISFWGLIKIKSVIAKVNCKIEFYLLRKRLIWHAIICYSLSKIDIWHIFIFCNDNIATNWLTHAAWCIYFFNDRLCLLKVMFVHNKTRVFEPRLMSSSLLIGRPSIMDEILAGAHASEHGENNFDGVSKNWARYRSKNNFTGLSKKLCGTLKCWWQKVLIFQQLI